MKNLLITLAIILWSSSIVLAQDQKVEEAEIMVMGNCSMCKTRIEKAVKIKEVKYAKWNKKTKMLFVAYKSPSMTIDSLQQRVAEVGHDTEKYKADNSVYDTLPTCCRYRDNDETH